MTQAYPLSWPAGWPRTEGRMRQDSRYRFKGKIDDGWRKPVTFEIARKKLCDELERLRAGNLVISTNLPIRADGFPYATAKLQNNDPGVAVYFTLKGRQMVMACDRYDAPSANIRSIGLAIEAMRQLERHGGGAMMERAFAGFAALPPPDARRPWREVLGPLSSPTKEAIDAAYRSKAKLAHPDAGGSDAAMAEVNQARADALASIGAQ